MRTRLLLLVLALLAIGAPVPALASPATTTARWTAPVAAPLEVTRPFEPPSGPYAAGHRGVDLGGVAGSVVLAAADGVVVFAGMVAGRPVVSIDHSVGLRTTYEPVEPSVAAGQPVVTGFPIGTLAEGHDGCPRAACLHWGVRRGESYLDPMLLLHPVQVRLLPWD